MTRLIAVLIAFLGMNALAADNALGVKGVRLWAAPDNTRLVFDTNGAIQHRVFSLHQPERLVIDIDNVTSSDAVLKTPPMGGLVKSMRSARRNTKDLRVVLDLTHAVKVKSFLLKPNEHYGHRLVIDMFGHQEPKPASLPVKAIQPQQLRDLIIAIDAGHGGEDPGAKGRRGTREKDVVLSISRKLARLVNKEPGMRAVLTRNGDYFLGLRKRMQKAREKQADMFISIHADAFRDRSVTGSSVFILSQRGASSEMARWLARSENASDLVGGVSLDDKDELLGKVLLDLAQTATRESSTESANFVFREMKQLAKTHKNHVQKAGFMVLKSPDIPSMLVETGFISNPTEEKRLRSAKYQDQIATAIMKGIRKYFITNPLSGTRMAKLYERPREHLVARGDTLSHIASKYSISMKAVRDANRMSSNRLLVGKVLVIPDSSTASPTASPSPQMLAAKTPPPKPRKYKVKRGDTLSHIAQRHGVTIKAIRGANRMSSSNRLLVGKVLVIPASSTASPTASPAPQMLAVKTPPPPPRKYKVKRGDTLSHIAQRHGVTMKAIRGANHMSSSNRLLVGKVLLIPASSTTSPTASPAPQMLAVKTPAPKPRKYKVKHGDTLSHIAQRHGVTMKAIRGANHMSSSNRLLVGKVLVIPASATASPAPLMLAANTIAPPSPRKYKVRRGDTLSHIAQRYGVSMKAIRSTNKIRSDRLLVGKVLTIPARDS